MSPVKRSRTAPVTSTANPPMMERTAVWRRRLGTAVGHMALRLQPGLSLRLAEGQLPRHGFQAYAARALLHRKGSRLSEEEIGALHRAWWSSRAALEHHRIRSGAGHGRFEPLLDVLTQALHENDLHKLCEIGCGDGGLLQQLAQRNPQLDSLIGLDLNLEQVLLNRARPRDARIHYRAADVIDWRPSHGDDGWAWLCVGGVLAYCSQTDVVMLFRRIAAQSAGLIALAEPLADEAVIHQLRPSFISGRSRRFSHPYPALIAQAGLQRLWMQDVRIDGHRWLMLLARCV